jgi:3-phytase
VTRHAGSLWLASLALLLPRPAVFEPAQGTGITVKPAIVSQPVNDDADDPAIWVNRAAPERSLIVGTNKVPAPRGALVVFDLNGKIVQTVAGLDRPNNVDVEYGLPIGSSRADIAVVTERLQHRLRVFRIRPDGTGLDDVSSLDGLRVFAGESGLRSEPMGIALFKRPSDGAIFAIVSRKDGPSGAYLWEYRLRDDGTGHVRAAKVREFGAFSGSGEIEAVAVDDELGWVYYADEDFGIHKWAADPDSPEAGREQSCFGRTGYRGDREGLAIYETARGDGYLLSVDQVSGSSPLFLYPRRPAAGQSQDQILKTLVTGADGTDGLDATSANLGPRFPRGAVVIMNSRGRNLLIYDWRDILR